ncbi:hypothetical protein VHEMI03301 [[Torrubiella] hemipterigena]|uniref:HNH nuclease domain-containing protein n=1 Tax=[Torrubiella] hemipterigena TaxID=1531966 RepID=A0A0A1SS76_9HYPO|nr:hypothetical protein VHEMI03301 [[Torrubiella] hemipterigena]
MREAGQGFMATHARLSGLRGDCLVRDKHRCVISRIFDKDKVRERIAPDRRVMNDDDQPIAPGDFGHLEVAHILPHSLVKVESNMEELDETRKTALEILNMFDNDIAYLINGVEIDRPRNALTLTRDLHQDFGRFEVYFTAHSDSSQPHTYVIETFLSAQVYPTLPIRRTLHLAADCNIEPPDPRLLAVHCAIAIILHPSAAGEYIHKILRGMEEQTVRSDCSTSLGDFVRLRIENMLAI